MKRKDCELVKEYLELTGEVLGISPEKAKEIILKRLDKVINENLTIDQIESLNDFLDK